MPALHTKAGKMPALPLRCAAAACLALLAACDPQDTNQKKTQPGAPEPPPVRATTQGGPSRRKRESLAQHARALPPSGQAQPASKSSLTSLDWTVEPVGNPARIARVGMEDKKRPQGKKRYRLAIELAGGGKERTFLRCEGLWRLRTRPGAAAVLAVHNATEGALKISLAFSMGARFIWYESTPRTLKPGWNRLRIEQDAARFKTRQSQWRHNAALPRRMPCRAVNLVIHNRRRTGRLVIETFSLSTRGKGAE